MTDIGITSERHALYVGAVLGLAVRHGLDAMPVVDTAGNYTNELVITFADATRMLPINVIVIVPPPPEDWTIQDWQLDD